MLESLGISYNGPAFLPLRIYRLVKCTKQIYIYNLTRFFRGICCLNFCDFSKKIKRFRFIKLSQDPTLACMSPVFKTVWCLIPAQRCLETAFTWLTRLIRQERKKNYSCSYSSMFWQDSTIKEWILLQISCVCNVRNYVSCMISGPGAWNLCKLTICITCVLVAFLVRKTFAICLNDMDIYLFINEIEISIQLNSKVIVNWYILHILK